MNYLKCHYIWQFFPSRFYSDFILHSVSVISVLKIIKQSRTHFLKRKWLLCNTKICNYLYIFFLEIKSTTSHNWFCLFLHCIVPCLVTLIQKACSFTNGIGGAVNLWKRGSGKGNSFIISPVIHLFIYFYLLKISVSKVSIRRINSPYTFSHCW